MKSQNTRALARLRAVLHEEMPDDDGSVRTLAAAEMAAEREELR